MSVWVFVCTETVVQVENHDARGTATSGRRQQLDFRSIVAVTLHAMHETISSYGRNFEVTVTAIELPYLLIAINRK